MLLKIITVVCHMLFCLISYFVVYHICHVILSLKLSYLVIYHILLFEIYIVVVSLFIVCCISSVFAHSSVFVCSSISSCHLTLLYIYASQVAHSECYISFAKAYCFSYIVIHEILFHCQSALSNLRKLLFVKNIDLQSKWFIYYVRALMYASNRFRITSIYLLCQNIDVHQQ